MKDSKVFEIWNLLIIIVISTESRINNKKIPEYQNLFILSNVPKVQKQ